MTDQSTTLTPRARRWLGVFALHLFTAVDLCDDLERLHADLTPDERAAVSRVVRDLFLPWL